MQNRTIMKYANEYTLQTKNQKKIMCKINKVQLYKKLLLLFELIRVDGEAATNTYFNNEEYSSTQQNFCLDDYKRPSKNDYQEWDKFKQWLRI